MTEEEEKRGFRVNDRRGQPKDEEPTVEAAPPPPPKGKKPPPSSVDFSFFVQSIASSALLHMGLVEDPQTGKTHKNPTIARQEIDILGMLEEKTKGNLTKNEQQMLTEILYELRMRFVGE